MGVWSHEPFGNDTAADWAWGLVESRDLSYVEATLDKVLEQGSQYLETSDAEEAVAAVEVLAKLLGNGTQSDAYTEDLDVWVASQKQVPSVALLQKGQRALERIVSNESELLELWTETDEAEAWKMSIEKLQAAIRI
ncbi:MAG: DUF4259 domain-containing protein [Pyrinomonadaceae bacterium]|nr:DUF4259 domain-containing protein [Pyrinomonadaceae bacterium]